MTGVQTCALPIWRRAFLSWTIAALEKLGGAALDGLKALLSLLACQGERFVHIATPRYALYVVRNMHKALTLTGICFEMQLTCFAQNRFFI